MQPIVNKMCSPGFRKSRDPGHPASSKAAGTSSPRRMKRPLKKSKGGRPTLSAFNSGAPSHSPSFGERMDPRRDHLVAHPVGKRSRQGCGTPERSPAQVRVFFLAAYRQQTAFSRVSKIARPLGRPASSTPAERPDLSSRFLNSGLYARLKRPLKKSKADPSRPEGRSG